MSFRSCFPSPSMLVPFSFSVLLWACPLLLFGSLCLLLACFLACFLACLFIPRVAPLRCFRLQSCVPLWRLTFCASACRRWLPDLQPGLRIFVIMAVSWNYFCNLPFDCRSILLFLPFFCLAFLLFSRSSLISVDLLFPISSLRGSVERFSSCLFSCCYDQR